MIEAAVSRPLEGAEGLYERWGALRAAQPGLRAREAASALGVSEAQLLACRVGHGVIELAPDWAAILHGLPALGEIMALTRNDHAVHEKTGGFDNVEVQPGHALVVNREIDLRIFLSHWRFGFAVDEEVRSGRRHSLQFFDVDGTAVHKVYLREGSNGHAYDALVAAHRRADACERLPVLALPERAPDRDDEEIDIDGLRAHWAALQDTHDFVGLLREFGVGRVQALRLAGEQFAHRAPDNALEQVLERAAADCIPIMCFVGNAGCIQIHTGPIARLKRVGRWYNVLDEGFNLHVDTDGIDSAWVVRKPTRDGDVTSLELYDRNGSCTLRLFGERKPGFTELSAWADALHALPPAS